MQERVGPRPRDERAVGEIIAVGKNFAGDPQLERLPGAPDQFWHQDELVWNLVPEPKPELQLASVIALVDFTADNGATRVFPGSNHWEAGRYPADEKPEIAEMPARAQPSTSCA